MMARSIAVSKPRTKQPVGRSFKKHPDLLLFIIIICYSLLRKTLMDVFHYDLCLSMHKANTGCTTRFAQIYMPANYFRHEEAQLHIDPDQTLLLFVSKQSAFLFF